MQLRTYGSSKDLDQPAKYDQSLESAYYVPSNKAPSKDWSDCVHVHAGWPWWRSWMRRPTGDQEVAGSTPAKVGNILSWRLIVKYFLRSFSPFRWLKKVSF